MRQETVRSISDRLRAAAISDIPELVRRYRSDGRRGVKDAVSVAMRRLERHGQEVERVTSLYRLQERLHETGHLLVAGVDEVGRGALAGPVTAGAVVLESGTIIMGLDDSKALTPQRRVELSYEIRQQSIACAVSHTDAEVVDAEGIVRATHRAMSEALRSLPLDIDHVLVDGSDASLDLPCTAVVGGDASCASIAAASIIAKVARDELMGELGDAYPGFDLGANKGYGTDEHMEAIRRLGPSPVHRRSFAPCRTDPTLF